MTNYEKLQENPALLGEIFKLSRLECVTSALRAQIKQMLNRAVNDSILQTTQEELAFFLGVSFYLNCRRDKCLFCSHTCETAKRSNLAHQKYADLKRNFFANPVIAKRRKVGNELFEKKLQKAGKDKIVSFGYAGTTEKEFRDTIPSELWLAMTITVGDCRKEFLKWLKQPAEHNEGDGKS